MEKLVSAVKGTVEVVPKTLLWSLAYTGAGIGAVWVVVRALDKNRWSKARAKWNSYGQDVVVLHQFPRPKKAWNYSPFPPKVEMFLKVAGIKYETDFDFPCSPKTFKSPWITLNGEDIADSQVIIETLSKKFKVDINAKLSPKDKALSRCLRIMCEEHLYWVLVMVFVDLDQAFLRDLLKVPNNVVANFLFDTYSAGVNKTLRHQAYMQGTARLPPEVIQKVGIDDLETLSTFLGTKTYMMGGEKPTEIDCVVFGFVQCILLTTSENSTHRVLIEKRLTNLKQHMIRMQETYFPIKDHDFLRS